MAESQSNPQLSATECYEHGNPVLVFISQHRYWGFEPMRWNSVKKIAQWAIFRNSPD